MKHIKYFFIFIIAALVTIFIYNYFFSVKINIGRNIEYVVLPTSDGKFNPINVSAFGKLSLAQDNQPKNMSQIISLNLIGSKILMREGIAEKNGSIVMPVTSLLDVISLNENKLVAQNDIWTVTIQKNSVTFVDKQGNIAELKSGFIGKYEY